MFTRDFLYVGVSALQVVLVALMTPILTRRVGVSQFGQLTLAILVAQLLGLTFSLGLPFAAQKVFAGEDGDHRSRGVLAISAAVAVAASLIAVLAAPAWGRAVGLDRVLDARLAAWWAACFAVTLTALALLRSEEKLRMAIFVAALQSLGAQAAGVLLLFWWAPTVTSYLCGLIIGQGAAALVGSLALTPEWSALAAIRHYGGTFLFGLPMVPQQLSGFILGLGDRVVIRHVLGSAAVGRYSVAYNLGNLGFILLVLVNQAWMPRIYAVADREARSRLLASSRDLMNLLLIPVVCGLAAAAPLVLEVWVPKSFHPAELTLIVAIVAICTFPFGQFVANLRALMSEGKTGRAAVATLIAAAVNIALNVVMVPFLGITGSAIATVLSYALCARLTRPPVSSGLQVPGASGLLRGLIAAAVAVILALGILPASPVWLAVRLVMATAAVLAFALLLRSAMAGLETSNSLVGLVAVREQPEQPVPMPVTSAGAKVQRRNDPLAGTGLLQSQVEWAVRGHALAGSLAALIRENLPGLCVSDRRGLDIGCQRGGLIDQVTEETQLSWEGIDPILEETSFTEKGAPIGPGRADEIPYPDAHFDAVILANVFEHITPDARQQSLDEICRVLKPGGILAGQIPNPYFPVESHSRLPFMGFLPISLQRRYWRLSPVPWEHDFFVVTMRHLRRHAVAAGLLVACTRPFNYPPEAIPGRVRAVARIGAPLMRVLPWAWQFVLIKPNPDALVL